MFGTLDFAPADPILGLEEAFKRDPNPGKIDLSVGVYRDAYGNTPVFRAVKRAEELILRNEISKTYLAIDGMPEYAAAVQPLLFGPEHPLVTHQLAVTAHTPGGTGGLRVAADFLSKIRPNTTVWVSQPTWPNHPNVFRAAGLAVQTYPYFDAAGNRLDFDAMMAVLANLPAGDAVVLHGSCHNPTGIDPTPKQWAHISALLAERNLLPLVDFAYQGLANGIDMDATSIRTLWQPGREMIVVSSYSKNFGLYNERTGALTLVAATSSEAQAALSHIKTVVRTNYSNPPAHGAKIVTTILRTPELRADWVAELGEMRVRIRQMREKFVANLAALGVQRDFSFLLNQNGMFSFTGLSKEQVLRLRQEYAIYLVDSGRVNVAGMTEANLPVLCQAVAQML